MFYLVLPFSNTSIYLLTLWISRNLMSLNLCLWKFVSEFPTLVSISVCYSRTLPISLSMSIWEHYLVFRVAAHLCSSFQLIVGCIFRKQIRIENQSDPGTDQSDSYQKWTLELNYLTSASLSESVYIAGAKKWPAESHQICESETRQYMQGAGTQ